MSDALVIFAAWLIGSIVWLMIQIGWNAWFVRSHHAYKHARACVLIGVIGGPVFVLGMYALLKIWDSSVPWTQLVVMPLFAGWVSVVALAGVHIAARLRGVLEEDVPK
jgi:hypothetical protein